MSLTMKLLAATTLIAAAAHAAPTCSTTTDVGPSAIVAASTISPGDCLLSQDKLYGNFNLSSLPSDTVLIFNLNSVGSIDHHQLSFGATFLSGHSYDWGYEIMVDPARAVPGTVMTSMDADFTQTVSDGASTLDKTLDPPGSAMIHEVKIGPIVQAGSVTNTIFDPGITDLVVSESLIDHGTISSVTNTVTQFVPGRNIPEPASLALLGSALAGLGFARRRVRKS